MVHARRGRSDVVLGLISFPFAPPSALHCQLAREAARKCDRALSADEVAADDVLWTVAAATTDRVAKTCLKPGIAPVVGVLTHRLPAGSTAEDAGAPVVNEAMSTFHRSGSNHKLNKRCSWSQMLTLGFELLVVALSGSADVVSKLEDMMQIDFMAATPTRP